MNDTSNTLLQSLTGTAPGGYAFKNEIFSKLNSEWWEQEGRGLRNRYRGLIIMLTSFLSLYRLYFFSNILFVWLFVCCRSFFVSNQEELESLRAAKVHMQHIQASQAANNNSSPSWHPILAGRLSGQLLPAAHPQSVSTTPTNPIHPKNLHTSCPALPSFFLFCLPSASVPLTVLGTGPNNIEPNWISDRAQQYSLFIQQPNTTRRLPCCCLRARSLLTHQRVLRSFPLLLVACPLLLVSCR